MKTHFTIIAALVVGSALAQTSYSKEVLEQIAQVENNLGGRVLVNGKTHNLQQRMAHYKVKGLSIAVVDDYKVVWAKGYGWADEKEKREVDPSTLFEPGSISKSLNGVGVLKLVQDKKLDLKTDINTYLRSWKFPYDSVSKNKKINLEHLLSHTGGLGVHGFPGYERSMSIPTLPEVLDGKKPSNTPAVRSLFEPGIKFKYSGGGTTISQLIITDVTGEPYAKYMDENILKPMGMVNSTYSQPVQNSRINQVATGYHSGMEINGKFHVYPEQGAAGLWMTPTDLCNYIIETQLSYEGRSSKLLTTEMTRLRLSPVMDGSALGVFIEDRDGAKYFQHNAGNAGFSGVYYGSLEGGKGVAVFINADDGGGLLNEVVNSVARVYDWKNFYKPLIKNSIQLPESLLANYTGTYMFEGMFATILKKDDGFYFLTDGTYSKMHFTSDKEFFNEEFSSEKKFLFDNAGKVTGYQRSVNGKLYPAAYLVTNPDTISTANPGQINNTGWYLLENRQFDLAKRFLHRGLELDKGDLAAVGNLGHCYLFTNDYDKALIHYKEFLEAAKESNPAMKDMISQDFILFKTKGFDTHLMDKVFADLKLEVPKEYKAKRN